MTFIFALVLSTLSSMSFAGPKVVYGSDNRKDIYEVTNPLHKTLALSTAGMIPKAKMKTGSSAQAFDIQIASTLGEEFQLCSSEKFTEQVLAPICSGFLVSPTKIVTAGHCVKMVGTDDDVCKNFAWVFDYAIKNQGDEPHQNVPITNIYSCRKIVVAQLDAMNDFAVIELDRPVVGRQPLKVRSTGTLQVGDPLVVIGHPSGLPTKVADGARVTTTAHPNRFSATLDTFHANSGSAVFNDKTGVVEGILIQGKTDYRPIYEKGCQVVHVCDDSAQNCAIEDAAPLARGEVVTRISSVLNFIK